MLKETLYLEDLILCLAGVAPIDESLDPPKLAGGDIQLLQSFGKQIIRNLGFTDRQNELAKQKVNDYKEYFSFLSNIDEIKSRNRIPLRSIDRSRWIRIVENSKGDYEIEVRFTFQKKLISSIDDVRRKINDRGSYDKETKIHSFEYSERNLFDIVSAFKDKDFDLSADVKEIYERLDHLVPEQHIPGIYNYKLLNLHPNGVKCLEEELGTPNRDNILLFKDRSLKYGLSQVDDIERLNYDPLAFKIAHRKSANVHINSTNIAFDKLLLTLDSLDRFPLLILLSSDSCYDTIVVLQEYVRNLISNNEVSVLFRLENQGEGVQFNEYVKHKKINNKLDKNTKVVYCLDSKIPKPMLNSVWEPRTILLYETRPVGSRKVLDCYSDNDLIIHYHDGQVPMHYFYRSDIEEIN